MAMKARYTVIDGEILSQTRNGVRHHYVPDAIGSVVALYDTNQAKTDSLNYWPYGEEQSVSGTTSTQFRYAGKHGYFRDASSRQYVRARVLRTDHGRWNNTDPIGASLNLYEYANGNPLRYVDSSGLQAIPGVGVGACPGRDAYEDLRRIMRNNPVCSAAFRRACPSGLTHTVNAITFITSNDCLAPIIGEWGACLTPPGFGPGPGCRPEYICYTHQFCNNANVRQRACMLLWELSNWCACKHRGANNENVAIAVIAACGLQNVCGPAGVVL